MPQSISLAHPEFALDHPPVLRVLLASRSPRRLELLRGAGVQVEPCPAPCDESARNGEPPVVYVRRVAVEKLRAAQANRRHDLPWKGAEWLAADTIVWTETQGHPRVFGKPASREQARQTLLHLSTTPHVVTTAWALDGPRGFEAYAETTHIWMRSLQEAELEAYLDTNAWCDKAGGYGIQAEAAGWVTALQGSYTNVVGLPLAQVLQRLQARREDR